MGYGTRNGTIRTFTPDDTDEEFYVEANYSGIDIQDLLDRIHKKWPGVSMEDIEICAEHIHTDCLGYDRYDSGDHTNYLKISKTK